MPKKISTSALGKHYNRPTREVFDKLLSEGLVIRENDAWRLTEKGTTHGGEYCQSKRFGEYIVWPEDLFTTPPAPRPKSAVLSSTKLGERFELSPTRMNKLLSEIGWINRGVKGWHVTDAGKQLGGYEKEHHKTGVPYVLWPEAITENGVLIANVHDTKGEVTETPAATPTESPEAKQAAEFRDRFEAKYRATDGHRVRSRGELAIDNWLYMSGLVHAYERRLPIEEELYCDFYLPGGKVYIEYWGLEEDARYAKRKAEKLRIYKKYNYNLVELVDDDICNLDDIMPRKLLPFGISAD